METTIDKFGRVLIPKVIRDDLGLQPGRVLEIKEDDQKILLEPLQEEPRMVMKKGVLVFSGNGWGDIEEVTRSHRLERLKKESSKIEP